MGTKRTIYHNNRIIHNGTTTVVYGYGAIKDNSDLSRAAAEVLDSLYSALRYAQESKGVARLNPEDTYDERLGVKVATVKSEMKSNKIVTNDLEIVRQNLEKLTNIVDNTLEELQERKQELEKKLQEI